MNQTVWAVISFVYAVLMAVLAVCFWHADRLAGWRGEGMSLGYRVVAVAALVLAVLFLIAGLQSLDIR